MGVANKALMPVAPETDRERATREAREERIARNEELRKKANAVKEDGFHPWSAAYWNDRYQQELNKAKNHTIDGVAPMEWYQRPDREGLMPLLETIGKPGMQVLIV